MFNFAKIGINKTFLLNACKGTNIQDNIQVIRKKGKNKE